MPFTFHATDLGSKFGFGDGDMLDDLLWDNGFHDVPRLPEDDKRWPHDFEHTVLCEAIRRFLLPKLPASIETVVIGTIHNPMRIENWTQVDMHATVGDVSATVSDDDVLALAREIHAGWK